MINVNNSITFTSRLKPVGLSEFTKISEPLYNYAFVRYPWTMKESVIARDAFTMDIYDCSAGGIIDKENKRVFLFHICPEMAENKCFYEVAKHITDAFSGVKGLRAFMAGSNSMFGDSVEMYDRIKGIILDRKIPLSEFRGTKDKTHILYSADGDEWLISGANINTKLKQGMQPKDVIEKCFEQVIVDSGDVL